MNEMPHLKVYRKFQFTWKERIVVSIFGILMAVCLILAYQNDQSISRSFKEFLKPGNIQLVQFQIEKSKLTVKLSTTQIADFQELLRSATQSRKEKKLYDFSVRADIVLVTGSKQSITLFVDRYSDFISGSISDGRGSFDFGFQDRERHILGIIE